MTSFFHRRWRRWHRLSAIASATLLTSWLGTMTGAAAIAESAAAHPPVAPVSELAERRLGAQFCPADLAPAMDAIVGRSQFATANWGIAVYPLSADHLLYTHNAERLLIPASNIKLMTTAAAIQAILEQAPDRLWNFRDDLNLVNRNSNNARADALLQSMGGQSRVRTMLAPLGVDPNSYIQADGSGLSRRNQAQPAAFVALLKGMYETDESGLFYDSLPVGGVSGTLRNRFKGTAAQGRVHAKTGTLRGVRALSGYLETADYGTVIFSIVINQPGQSGSVMLDAIDEMVLTMAQLESCQ